MPYVQFSDETHLEIISSFGGPQEHLANTAEIPTWDIRWKLFAAKFTSSLVPFECTERWEDQSGNFPTK